MSNIRTIIANSNRPSHTIMIIRIRNINYLNNLQIAGPIYKDRCIIPIVGQIIIILITLNGRNINKSSSLINPTNNLKCQPFTNSQTANINNTIGIGSPIQNRSDINKTIRQNISHLNTTSIIRTIISDNQIPSNLISIIRLSYIN